MGETTWHFVVEFSCMVEKLKGLNRNKILACRFHPSVPGDALVTMHVEPHEVMSLPFKTYTNNREQSEMAHGGLKVWKVSDMSSFVGQNSYADIIAEYNL